MPAAPSPSGLFLNLANVVRQGASSLELGPENRILVHQSLATPACRLISSAPNVPEAAWGPRSVTDSADKGTDSTTTGNTIAREGAP